jgi:hypothetical protein
LPLFWLEYFRHIYISRWRLAIDYSKVYDSGIIIPKFKYPSAFIHELYWFKYQVYFKYIKKN